MGSDLFLGFLKGEKQFSLLLGAAEEMETF